MKIDMERAIYPLIGMARTFMRGQEDGLWIRLNAHYHHYYDNEEFHASRRANLVLVFPYGSGGSVNTFFGTSDGYQHPSGIAWNQLENISNHDSCWRDAISSELHKLFMKLSTEVMKEVEEGPGYFVPNPKRKETRVMMRPCDVDFFNTVENVEHLKLKLERYKDLNLSGSSRYRIAEASSIKSFSASGL